MKKIFFYMLIATALNAQTVYEVVPGTVGNEILLSVVNESQTASAENVTVRLTNCPKGIEVKNTFSRLDLIKSMGEKLASFTFDAKRTPAVQKDTLKFLITDDNGNNWKKEIILVYSLPKEFKLEQNYPNPFNPSTVIEFSIPQKGSYTLGVFNVLGQFVSTIIQGEFEPGYYKTDFNAAQLASGIYIYRLHGNNVCISKKMLLVK